MTNFDSFYIDISRINLAHEFVLDKNNRCEYLNSRKYYGVVYCIEGEAEYRFKSGEKCRVCEGEVLLLSAKASYSIITKKEFRHYTVNFEINEEYSDIDFFTDDFYLLSTANSQWYRHNFKELVMVSSSRKVGFMMQATACLYQILALLCSEILEKKHHTKSHVRLRPAREYTEQNFSSDISLDMLANLCNMSVTNFRREWLKLYGETALQYRDRLRLCYAKECLISGYYTVNEVATKCGFSDVNYFIRFFKKHTGTTPGRFLDLV